MQCVYCMVRARDMYMYMYTLLRSCEPQCSMHVKYLLTACVVRHTYYQFSESRTLGMLSMFSDLISGFKLKINCKLALIVFVYYSCFSANRENILTPDGNRIVPHLVCLLLKPIFLYSPETKYREFSCRIQMPIIPNILRVICKLPVLSEQSCLALHLAIYLQLPLLQLIACLFRFLRTP